MAINGERTFEDGDRLHIWYAVNGDWTYHGWSVGGIDEAIETAKTHANGRDFRITETNSPEELNNLISMGSRRYGQDYDN